MVRIAWGFFICLFLPAFAFGASAGFPDQSVWLSDATPTRGQEVTVYTVVYNALEQKIDSSIVFMLDGGPMGTQSITLEPGETKVVSIPWTAQSGNHSFAARFNTNGVLQGQETQTVPIAVAEPPPPTALQQGVHTVSTVAGAFASSSAPIVTEIVEKVFAATESFRESGLAFAENHMSPQSSHNETPAPAEQETQNAATSHAKSQKDSESRGGTLRNEASAVEDGVTGFEAPPQSWTARLSQLAAPAIAFTFGSKAIFYPALLILLLLILYLLGRWATRPRF